MIVYNINLPRFEELGGCLGLRISTKAGVSGKTVAAGQGAAAAVAVGAAAAAGKKSSTDDETDENADDTTRLDVGVPFEATPTYTGQAEAEPLDRDDATTYGAARRAPMSTPIIGRRRVPARQYLW